MKKLIEKIILKDGKIVSRRITESYVKKNHNVLYHKIIQTFDNSISFSAKLFLIYHDLIEIPKCKICGNKTQFNKFSIGFSKYCSNKCVGLDSDIIKQKENTMLLNHGVKYTLQSESLRKKIKQTNLRKYKNIIPQQTKEVKEKTRQTNLRKYGVEQHLQLNENVEKNRIIFNDKYGVNNPQQIKEVKEKTKQTNLKKYGVEKPSQNSEIKEKTKQTNLRKYGVECGLLSDIIKEKTRQTNLRKYGVEKPSQNSEIKKKIKQSNIITKEKTSIKYWVNKLNISVSDINKVNEHDFEIHNYCDLHTSFIIQDSLLKNRLRLGCSNICTLCNPISQNTSIKEKELLMFINSLKLNYVENDRNILNGKEIDVYLPNNKLGIEFNGLYWHSEVLKDKNYHLNKTEECEKQGIQLLHVFEDEWIYKKEIVKSMIRSKLGIIENKIFARKTEIRELFDNKLVRNFLETNHIQGFVGSKVKIGLFYENQLVTLMTFGKKRLSMGNKVNLEDEYEILRFCNKLNTTVIGGAGKLLNYFIKIYHPKSIISFADRRYSQGKLYEQLGFNIINKTRPNYYYFDNKKKLMIRFNRFNYRKDVLVSDGFAPQKSEHEIMNERGFLRIYDAGSFKFELIL